MTFGAYTVDSDLGEGRFGPVFRAHDADRWPVLVRTFIQTFSPDQRDRFMAALNALCQAPLEHPSIARPLACGLAEDGRPYVVHAYLAGTPLSEFTTAPNRRGIDDIVNRLTYLAGALDFAAAVGVVHGALTDADVILSSESAGVSGMGLVQALELAGVAGFRARREEDIAALMEIARNLLGGLASPAVESLLSGAVPSSALAFAGALHRTIDAEWDPAAAADAGSEPAHSTGWPATAAGTDGRGNSAAWAPPTADRQPPTTNWQADAADWAADTTDSNTPVPFSDVSDLPQHPADEFVPEAADSHIFVREAADSHVYDVHLQPAEDKRVAPVAPAMFGAIPAEAMPRGRQGSRSWLLVGAIALALGVLTGFAGGFFVGSEIPTPDPVTQTDPPQPTEPTTGQTFTDAPIEEQAIAPGAEPPRTEPAGPPSSASPAPEPQASAPQPASVDPTPPAGSATPERPAAEPPARTARGSVPTPPPSSGPAAIRVDSLPTGAQVFVDGRSVGYTPLVVGGLMPGTHSIRMQLPGYRPWVNAVTLGPGARERIAASLEQ